MEKVYMLRLSEEHARVIHELVQDFLLEAEGLGKYPADLLSAEVELTRQLFDEQGLEPRNAELVGEPYPLTFDYTDFRVTVKCPGPTIYGWSSEVVDVFVHIGNDGVGSVTTIKDVRGNHLSEYPFEVDEDWVIVKCQRAYAKRHPGLDRRIT